MGNVLLAGGAGFIGSHLCDRLLLEGHKVICFDKLIMGSQNVSHLRGNPNFILVNVDLSDGAQMKDALDKAVVDGRIDCIYHLAANSDIQKGGKEPGIDFNDTLLTTRNLLEVARRYNVKNFFFASTSAVYGEKGDEVLIETTGDLRPVSYYGGAKLASEALISSYTSMNEMHTVIFRFPNVIGPRLTHGVIFDFVKKLRRNSSELEVLGNGKQCKPYIYVFDLVEAIMQRTEGFFAVTDSVNKAEEVIYNISVESEGTTVTRIAEIVVEELGLKNVTFKYTGGDRGWKGDVPRFSYDISKVLKTGWKPKYTSDEAVRKTIRDAIEAGM